MNDKYTNLHVPSVSLMVTEYCTLKCKLCLAYVPYYNKPQQIDAIEAKKVLDKYFTIIESVDKFSITGGEPLMNPELNKILKIIFDKSSQINQEIILITNGTILFSESTLSLLEQEPKVKVIVNNYGFISKYAKDNNALLQQHGIRTILYSEENRYQWVDCRDHSKKHITELDRIQQAKGCAFFQGKKYIIDRGELHTCTRSFYRIHKGLIPYSESDYINLLDEEMTIDDMRNQLMHLLNKESTNSCAYCDGRTEKSVMYLAAEQLEEGDEV